MNEKHSTIRVGKEHQHSTTRTYNGVGKNEQYMQ